MVTNGFITGFLPVPGSAGATAPQAGGQQPSADGALGLFEALLGFAPAPVQAAAKVLGAAATAVAGAGANTPDLAALQNASVPATVAATPAAKNGEATLPADAEPLLLDLLEALTALAETTAGGTPADPALEADVAKKLKALADALGIALPTTEASDVVAAVVAGGPTDVLDPLAALAAAETPETPNVDPDAADDTEPVALPETAPAGAIQSPAAITPTATEGQPQAAVEARPLPPAVAQIVEKLGQMAAALEPRAPGLAKQLQAFADRLAAPDLDANLFAKLGIPTDGELPDAELDAAIQRLLTAGRDIRPLPAPQAFASHGLSLPEAIVTTGQQKSGPALPSAAQSGTKEPESETRIERDPRPAPEPRTADRVKAEPEAPQRNGVSAPGPAAAAPESSATQQTATTGVAAAAGAATVTADARVMHAAYAAPVRQINIPQVAFEIARHVQAGASRFTIRLDPPELGRVDVKLDMDGSGNVNARMTVERAETLDLMQRDQRALERALAQAGLDSSKTNLEFSLRQNPFAHQEQQQHRPGNEGSFASLAGLDENATTAQASVSQVLAYRGTASPGGVNLFV